MTVIHLEKVKDLYYADILYGLHVAQDKIKNFEIKYGKNFLEFEKKIKKSDEDFSEWDDYLEWKAFEKSYAELKSEQKDIENGNYKISL